MVCTSGAKDRATVAHVGGEMKLVDILARELEEWPHEEAKLCVQDRDGSRDVKFSASTDSPVFDKSDGVWRYALGDAWRGESMIGSFKFVASKLADDSETAVMTRSQWQAARSAYLASIQPERDAEISKIVESALQTQQGGTHYKDMALQPWEAIDAWLTHEQHMGYLLGTALAYLARYNAEGVGKGGMQDVKKAVHTLQRMIEVSEKE